MNKGTFLVFIVFVCIFLIVTVSFQFFKGKEKDDFSVQDNIIIFDEVSDGNTSFFDVYQLNESFGQTAYGLASADFNDDGLLDFAVSYATSPFTHSTISLFYNLGALTFEQVDLFSFNYTHINDLDAGDFTGDGYIDLVFSFNEYRWFDDVSYNMNGTLVLARNNGANDFSNLSVISQWTSEDYLDLDRNINLQMTSADYNHDGLLDLAVGGNSGTVELLVNQGNGSFYNARVIDDFGWYSWGLTTMDTSDGYTDFIVAAAVNNSTGMHSGFLYHIPSTKSLDCFDSSNISIIGNISSGSGTGSLRFVDIDNDGYKELIMGVGSQLLVYKHEDGWYYLISRYSLPGTKEGYADDLSMGGMTIGDFNNDGNMDFITGGVQGNIRLFLNNDQEH